MIKNILFDFDGVILDSMPIRQIGFRKIFQEYPSNLVEELITYHEANGGLSRFVKIRYFYEEILKKNIKEETINELANKFSEIMKIELTNKDLLINDCVDFIESNYKNYNFHIVSGSEHNELNYLNKELGLSKYFLTINGSPTPKKQLVFNLMNEFDYNKNETILIGDSINDYDAAKYNGISFYGYNNSQLKSVSNIYLDSLRNL